MPCSTTPPSARSTGTCTWRHKWDIAATAASFTPDLGKPYGLTAATRLSKRCLTQAASALGCPVPAGREPEAASSATSDRHRAEDLLQESWASTCLEFSSVSEVVAVSLPHSVLEGGAVGVAIARDPRRRADGRDGRAPTNVRPRTRGTQRPGHAPFALSLGQVLDGAFTPPAPSSSSRCGEGESHGSLRAAAGAADARHRGARALRSETAPTSSVSALSSATATVTARNAASAGSSSLITP